MEWYKIAVIVFWVLVYIWWSYMSIKDIKESTQYNSWGDHISTVAWVALTSIACIVLNLLILIS